MTVWKRCAVIGALLLAACAVVRLASLQGLFFPVRIAGSSMAETCYGTHYELRCADCRFPCRYDAEFPPTDDRVVCPNCGFINIAPPTNPKRQREEPPDRSPKRQREGPSNSNPKRQRGEPPRLRHAERVLIDRAIYWLRSPQRWEIVAFRADQADDFLAVKRIVALPGEAVAIRHGDIYIDGHIARKTLDQLRDMAVLVHDSTYQPSPSKNLPPRWAAESSASGWLPCEGACVPKYIFRNPTTSGPQDAPSVNVGWDSVPTRSGQSPNLRSPDWLTYRHWRCVLAASPRTEEYAVLDNDGYNQADRRSLHRVTDLLLVCHARIPAPGGVLFFKAHDGYDWFFVALDFESRQARLQRREQLLASAALPPAAYAQNFCVELALCDRQVLFAVDGQVFITYPYKTAGSFRPTPRPLGIGAAGLDVEIRRLQVFRDLYYLDPHGLSGEWSSPRRLGRDKFFVIGDNVPISQDSRHGPVPGVPRERLLGRVLRLR